MDHVDYVQKVQVPDGFLKRNAGDEPESIVLDTPIFSSILPEG